MPFALKKILPLGLALAACSESAKNGPSSPSASKVPQVLVVSDVDSPIEAYWDFPAKEVLAAALGARVEWEKVGDDAAAAEKLRVWNARPLDLVVLGPGRPQSTWNTLRLPRNAGRVFVAVGAEKTPAEGVGATVPAARVTALATEFCRQPFGKAYCGGASAMDLRKLAPGLSVRARWADFLKDLLSGKPQLSRQGLFAMDFFSGYLEAIPGPALSKAPELEAFGRMKKEFMLKELGGAAGL